MSDNGPVKARPEADVLREVMDVCRPKSEHEWVAAREIETLRSRLGMADARVDDCLRRLGQAESENAQLRAECEELRERNEQLEAEKKILQGDWRIHNDCIVRQQDELDRLRAALSQQKAGETIPRAEQKAELCQCYYVFDEDIVIHCALPEGHTGPHTDNNGGWRTRRI